jgi:hypothetical protein
MQPTSAVPDRDAIKYKLLPLIVMVDCRVCGFFFFFQTPNMHLYNSTDALFGRKGLAFQCI